MDERLKVLIFGNKVFSVDMLWGVLAAGHDARIILPATKNALEAALDESGADVLLTLGPPLEFGREISEFIGARQSAGYKHIHWDTDGISSKIYPSASGDGIEMDLIYRSKPDLVLTMCPEMLELIRSKGFTCEYMRYAYSPISHRPLPGFDNDRYFINLIGNSYYREFGRFCPSHYRYKSINILLKPLLENGYTVHFYGDRGYSALLKERFGIVVPPASFHGYMPYEKTCAAYNSSFVNLVTQNHEHTVTKRTFEILGSGGFALSADNSEIRKLFVPGRDLVVSSSPEQTLELVHYYKEHPDEWRQIRKNAVLSVQNHTYKQRAEFIMGKYRELWQQPAE